MKVGIYIRDIDPTAGGAFQFSNTVTAGIKKLRQNYEVTICYRGRPFSKMVSYGGDISYININSYLFKHYFKLMFKQIRLDLNDIKRKFTFRPRIRSSSSLLDDVAKTYGIDIYWFIYPEHEVLSTPFIYTLWDLGHRELPMFPEVSTPVEQWNIREARYTEMLPRASYILTGNQTGKQEILSNYSVPESKIRIAPFEISSFCYGEEKEPEIGITGDYFLYPAQFWPHKNHICIIEALKVLREQYEYYPQIVFTGADKGNRDYVKKVAADNQLTEQLYFMGYVSDEELKYLYTHAKALIFASIMGPNNIPPMEAIYLGCPVIISNLEGHKEQMEDAAVYFENNNPKSLANVLYSFGNNSDKINLREKMLAYNRKLKEYSYSVIVIEILEEFSHLRMSWDNK